MSVENLKHFEMQDLIRYLAQSMTMETRYNLMQDRPLVYNKLMDSEIMRVTQISKEDE